MVERKIKNMNLYVFERDEKPTDDFIQEVNEWVNLQELQVIDYIIGHDRNGYIQLQLNGKVRKREKS